MNPARSIWPIAIVASLVTISSHARADDPAPDPAQLDAAKQAYEDGKALYAAGKIAEAIDKLQLSYRLSGNAFLLYNIALAYDQSAHPIDALTYYKRFIASAPANAPMHDDVVKRIAALEHDTTEVDPSPAPAGANPTSATAHAAGGLSHQPVDTAGVNRPLELAIAVNTPTEVTATLFYRGGGDATFTSAPMTLREQRLVATIPGERMTGRWIQYYLEVRDRAGVLVQRWGKSTSPNLVNLDDGSPPQMATRREPEDPLLEIRRSSTPRPMTRLAKAKWISSGSALVLLGGTVVFYELARHESNTLRTDAASCGTPPCRAFDVAYDQRVETRGVRYNTIYQVGLGVTVAAIGVAGYLWYRDLSTSHRAEAALVTSRAPRSRWTVVPAVVAGFTGVTAVAGF